MGRRGRPKKEKVQEEPQEIVNTEPKEEEIKVLEKEEEVEEPIPEPEETNDFDLTKQNEYLVAGFKASKHYTTDEKMIEENFKKYVKTGE